MLTPTRLFSLGRFPVNQRELPESAAAAQPTVFTTRRIVRCFVVPKPFKQVVYVLLAASPRNFRARLVAFFYCAPSRSAVKVFCKR